MGEDALIAAWSSPLCARPFECTAREGFISRQLGAIPTLFERARPATVRSLRSQPARHLEISSAVIRRVLLAPDDDLRDLSRSITFCLLSSWWRGSHIDWNMPAVTLPTMYPSRWKGAKTSRLIAESPSHPQARGWPSPEEARAQPSPRNPLRLGARAVRAGLAPLSQPRPSRHVCYPAERIWLRRRSPADERRRRRSARSYIWRWCSSCAGVIIRPAAARPVSHWSSGSCPATDCAS